MNNRVSVSILSFFFILFYGCSSSVDSYESSGSLAKIYPEYTGTYIPYNIAPLNFEIQEDADKFIVRFVVEGKDSFEVNTKQNVMIPIKKWKKLLNNNKGEKLMLRVFSKKDEKWTKYNDLVFSIAQEPIDSYLAYRLIEPGYSAWNRMGIYQRCLENYDETPILKNTLTSKSCMNCHTFHKNNPETMVFHIRGEGGGTVLAKEGEATKINTKMPWMMAAGVYPRWHPDGRYIAFSTNQTKQFFHTLDENKIEVLDLDSDLVIYDTENNKMFTDSIIQAKDSYETFPEWSPDGKYLYFCTAPALPMPNSFADLKYSLVRVAYDVENETFSNQVDTLFSAYETGKSVSLPRISPDGKRLVFCLFDYGTFPIWHKENDLYELNLESGKIRALDEVNSNESDSFHSFSSNGRWMVFSSRRMDGTYTHPFITYLDDAGNWHKPFLLPQKHPDHYDFLIKSFNVPEFITGKVKVSPYTLQDAWEGKSINPMEKE